MAKALRTASLVVGAVALVAAGVATANPGLIVAGAKIGTIATVANVAAGALTVAATLTAKKPSSQATGSQTSFAADPDAGIPWVIGRTGTAGNIVARFGFDTRDAGDNDRQSFVAVLSLGPVQAIESFSADRSPVTFDSGGRAIGGFSTFMWQTRQLGALSGPALGFGTGAGSPPGWTASHKLSGKAAATWTLRFDTKAKLYQNGVPAPMWVVQGALCYDPRKDSSYPGGSGLHRMADPADTAAYDAAAATWEYTENPYILGLRFIHGIWQRDTSNAASKWQRVMGMGAPQAGIDIASYVEGANVADANGWKAGGVIYSGDDKWGSLKKILQAGMGEPLALGAKIGCLVNAPKVSLATIGIDDVVGDASVSATQPRRSRINTITPRYRLESNNWQLLPGAPIAVADHIATDRGRRSRVQDYPFIQNSSQVGTAVRYDVENSREFGPIVLPLKLYWMGYKPGDCVTASLPELGLNAQPILLLNRSLDPSGGIVTMTARSETPGKHPFALGQTATPPPTPGVTGVPVVPVPGDGVWAISATEMVSGSTSVPALIVTGSVDAGTVDSIVFEYRPFFSGQAADAGWIAAGIEVPTTTRKEIVSVTGSTAYEVGVSYRARGVQGARRILGPVTTSDFSGAGGAPGLNNATITIYQRSASGTPALPSAPITHNFVTGVVTGLNNGWVATAIPAGTDPLYASAATASSASTTDTVAASEWAAARQILRNGVNGTSGANTKSLFIYQRAASTPALPSQPANYTFSTAALTGLTNGWSATIPAANGQPLWVSTATAFSTDDVDAIPPGEWATAQLLAQDGRDAPLVLVQWSVDGMTNWHADYAQGDKFQRQSNDNGQTWGPAVRVVGESASSGQDGISPSIVFRRSATIPSTPTRDTGNPPTGWSDDPPAGTDLLWQSVSKFRGGVQLEDWSPPVRITGPAGQDGKDAISITLDPPAVIARLDQNGAYVPGQVTTFNATRSERATETTIWTLITADGQGGFSGTAAQFVSAGPSQWQSSGPDNLTLTASGLAEVMGAYGGTVGKFLLRAYSSGAQAISTIQKLADGARGASAPLVRTQWSIDGMSNWHDNYMGADLFYRQSNDNGATWGPPIRGVGESGTGVAVAFLRSSTVPPTPPSNTGNPPTGWSDAPPPGTDFLWLVKANYINGTQQTAWSAPQRISGEDGFVLSANPPAFVIPAFSNGTAKPSWTGGSCALSLNKGGQAITPDGGYSIAAQNGVASLAISGNTVTFAGILADKAEFTGRATHQGKTYDQRVTMVRAKDGEAAFKGSAVITGSGTQATGSGVTVVPSGRSAIVSGVADYTINQAQPGNFRASMALYWRNVTDGGAWNLLGSQDGSFATSTNVGSSAEPEYQYISGTVSASFGFVAPSGDKQIAFEARVSRSGGDRTADIGGQVKLEVSS